MDLSAQFDADIQSWLEKYQNENSLKFCGFLHLFDFMTQKSAPGLLSSIYLYTLWLSS